MDKMDMEQENAFLGEKVKTQTNLIESLQKDNFNLLSNQINLNGAIDCLNKENSKLSNEVNYLNRINTSLNYTYNQMVYEALDKIKN